MAILIFIIVLAVLILVHECGHYLAAKWSNTRVDEFGIGYPPRAVRLFRSGETLFTLNWIPFGGFVKIFGENPTEEYGPETGRSFQHKPAWIKALILIAGVLFNMIFAWLIFAVIFAVGTPMALERVPQGATISNQSLLVTNVLDESPAAVAGIQAGDAIAELSADGAVLEEISATQVQSFIATHGDGALTVSVERSEGEVLDVLVLPKENLEGVTQIGVGLAEVGTVTLPPHRALTFGFTYTAQLTVDITAALGTLIADAFRGSGSLDALTGPVGIVGVVGDAAHAGIMQVLLLTAIISINLAVINLLPIPALDGGRLLFLALEQVKGSPIPPKVFGWANTIGFALLMILMIVVTINDVIRLF